MGKRARILRWRRRRFGSTGPKLGFRHAGWAEAWTNACHKLIALGTVASYGPNALSTRRVASRHNPAFNDSSTSFMFAQRSTCAA